MKVPTDATKVFAPVLNTGTGANTNISSGSFAPDMLWNKTTDHAYGTETWDKLRGVRAVGLTTSNTGAEGLSPVGYDLVSFNNTGVTEGANSGSVMNITSWLYVNYMFGRAPSFFDICCYTGNGGSGSPITVSHNLGVVPELMIVKGRNYAGSFWTVYTTTLGNTQALYLNATNASTTDSAWGNTTPTSTVFTVGSNDTNNTGKTYVTYLFATCAGVSKVGSYTGNGSTQTIDCGFGAGGARFVLIKRTDATGGWYVYDTARGMTVLTDPYWLTNSAATEAATLGSVTTVSTGFALNSTALAAINVSGGTYIFLAIA
jgi:hypothetical protein